MPNDYHETRKGHAEAKAAFVADRVPIAHRLHCAADVAFSMGRKYPGSHMVHRTLPSFSAYDPVGQSGSQAPHDKSHS